jgi:hypothetical protein
MERIMFGIYGGAGFGARGTGGMATRQQVRIALGQNSDIYHKFRKFCQIVLSNRNHILFDAMYQETNTTTSGRGTDGL